MKNLFLMLIGWSCIFPNAFSMAHAEVPPLENVQVGNIQIGYVSRDFDGSLYILHPTQAIHKCATLGQHLPSISEMVEIALVKNARGIVADSLLINVHGKNLDGTVDSYYYDWSGYNWPEIGKRPDGSSWTFITSTKVVNWPRDYYKFDISAGQISQTDAGPFFCIK